MLRYPYLNPLAYSPLKTTFNDVVASLNPVLWYKTDETSGTTANNSGSLGATGNGTIAGTTTLNQALGARTAYLYNALDSVINVNANTAFHNLTTLCYAGIYRLASSGENNNSNFVCENLVNRWFRIESSNMNPRFFLDTSGTDANATANNAFLTVNTNTMLFATYDDAGDRRPRIYKYTVAGGLVEATYSSQVAGTGTLTNGSGTLRIGNRPAIDRTLDGLQSNFIVFPVVPTLDQMALMGVLAGL